MGACKSRQTKTNTAKTMDTPLLQKAPTKAAFKLRPDAQPYVPHPEPHDEPEVMEQWEIFLEQKKRDLAAKQKGLRRAHDGSYTAEYRSLLVRPVRPWARDRSPERRWEGGSFDVRDAWRSGKRAPSPPAKDKKRKPSALKKAILAQRDGKPNELWAKFEEHLQKKEEAKVKDATDPEKEEAQVKDDLAATPVQVPFGLSDRCYLSDSEDLAKAHRHREPAHVAIREFVDMQVTPALEAAVTETLFTLRRLRKAELGLGLKSKRYTVGFREVTRVMAQKSAQCLLFAPDVERTSGVLEDKIACLVKACEEQQVPVLFALSRRQLGAAIQKNVSVSVLAILETRGAREPFERMLDEASKARALRD